MSALRPLPPKPNLEFEHKEAKALLRLLRAGDSDALARALERHPALEASSVQLADAQLVIAREYGFASWPKLVRYFGDVERQRFNYRSVHFDQPQIYDMQVRSLIAGHGKRYVPAGRSLAAYVPRFYGMRVEDVFATTVTEDEARLAVARQQACPSWAALQERVTSELRDRPGSLEANPWQLAAKVMEARDLDALQRLTEAHPILMRRSEADRAMGRSLLRSALHQERRQGRAELAPIVDWLITQGFDVQEDLNRELCGRMRMDTDDVRWLLERGADPNWIAPNGIPVLEYALIRWWNGEAVDLVAARARPRQTLWVAAGLGDVQGVRRSLDAQGKPTDAVREFRPDFDAVGQMGVLPPMPDASDEEVLAEAFFIAILNGRTAVLEYMVSRGFPVDSLIFGSTHVAFAVGNAMVPVVECLARCGANLDLKGWGSQQTARQMARELFEERPEAPGRRRIVELCGMDPEAVLRERDARPVPPPQVGSRLTQALELAGDDAARLGQSDIRPENLLFGLLRGDILSYFIQVSRLDLDRFRAESGDRLRPAADRIERMSLPLHVDAQAMVQAAIAAATERRHDTVDVLHLALALTGTGAGPAENLLVRCGSSAAILHEALKRGM